MNAPTLSTPRLILRPHVPEDFDFVAAMWANPEVVRFIGAGLPLSRDEAWLKFLRFPGRWALTGFGSWAIEEKASGQLIGEAGFIERNLPADNPRAGIPELGYGVVPEAAGKGYVTGSGARGAGMGAGAFRARAHHRHHHAGQCCVGACGRELAVSCARADIVSGGRTLMLFERIL